MVTGSASTGTLHVLNLLKDTLAHMSSQVLCTWYLLLLWYVAMVCCYGIRR